MKTIAALIMVFLFGIALNAQTGQTVKGKIIDEASKAPIVGVVVQILQSETTLATTTNANGQFKLLAVPLGRQSFKISLMGYQDRILNDIIVTAGKEVVLNISMEEKISLLKQVDFVYERGKDKTVTNNEMTTVSARSFNIEETKKYAGALGDPSRMAANFAGVVSGNDSRNDIVVRGNSPNGMLWQLEGLNIPNPNHFGALNSTGGPVSMLNNNNLSKSDFLTSAFPAQYGNALAGVFDLRLRDGNNEKHEFVGQIGFNGFEAGAEGPLGKKGKASYLVNYRYSTLGVFQQLGINFGTGSAIPLYQDVNYKITIPTKAKGKFTLFGIAGNSKIDFLGNEADTSQANLYSDRYTNTRVRYATNITGASYEYQINKKASAKLTAGYSRTFERFNGDSISYLTLEEFETGDATFRTDKYSLVGTVYYKINSKNNLVAGFYGDYTHFNIYNKRIFGTTPIIRVDQTGEAALAQAFVQWKHRFSEKLSLVSGINTQYHDVSKRTAVQPRAGLRYQINGIQAISLGYGLHAQTQSIYTYFVQTPTSAGVSLTNKNLDFSKSHHAVLTYDWNIAENLRLKSEVYYQYLFNVPIEQRLSSFSALNVGADFGPSNEDSLVNNGTGHNYGLELTLEKFFSNQYYFLITASLFNSKYEGSDRIERNTAFNTGHVLNILAGKEFKLGKKSNLLLSIKQTWTGGRYLTPIDQEKSALAREAVYNESLAYSNRQKDYFRVDFKIGYRRDFAKSSMEFSLDLQNITNNQNVFRQSYDPLSNSIVTEFQQGFFPVPMFRMTF